MTSVLPPALQRALSGPSLPRLVTLGATAVVAGQLALLVWKLLPQKPHAAPPVQALPESAAMPGLASQVFGAPPPPEAAAATQVSAIALTLVGTLAAKDPTAGLAIVGPTVNDAHVYATQTDIAPGVRLLEVYTEHILIDRGGAKETINLPRTGGGIGMPVAAQPIADVARQAAAAPEVIGDLMRPMPNYVAGQLRGFKLFPGRDLKRFRALGLEPGDLITQVNNVPIGDAQHGLEMLQALGTATSATVMVERGGVIQSITIDSSQLQLSSDPRHSGAGTPAPAAESNSNE